jgi:type IV secretory pathway VirB4 component
MEKLYSQKLAKQNAASPTQQYLDVAEVKEDVIVLKNGSLRAVLAVSAINFELKSTDEQEAIISQYQNFLNSVDFPLQVLISSRKLNIDTYLDFLTDKEKQQKTELMRLQISEYKNFISQLVSMSDIMDKSFYLIVPFSPIENQDKSFFSNFSNMLHPQKGILEKRENFETYKNQLYQRVDHLTAGLSGIGVKIVPLKTQELIELLFNAYNPTIFDTKGYVDTEKMELK